MIASISYAAHNLIRAYLGVALILCADVGATSTNTITIQDDRSAGFYGGFKNVSLSGRMLLDDTSSSSSSSATCSWPIDLTAERDGTYGDRTALSAANGYRGRAGNAIIQYMAMRLGAASGGGFAPPWSGLLEMGNAGNKNRPGQTKDPPLVWGPRFGKLSVCGDHRSGEPRPYSCPKADGRAPSVSAQLPKSVAKQACPSSDAKFHQNYEYFRGLRDAARYFMATADDLEPEELAAWEKAAAPVEIWKPKPWLGPNDAVLHLRFFEDTRQVDKTTGAPCDHGSPKERAACPAGTATSLACWNALTHTHLCSWHRDLVDDKLFTDGTCDQHVFAPPLAFYEKLFQERAAKHPNSKEGSVGGWDNVWLLSDPKGHNSAVAKQLVGRLGVKVPFEHSDRGYAGPLGDIWSIKSANYVIQSYGTFSWVGAFLGNAKEVHKPYTSNNWANHWAEESSLFVDDQPEWVYHNTETAEYFQSAQDVLAAYPNSAFAAGVKARPKPKVLPIGSTSADCARLGGTWNACSSGGGEQESVAAVKAATCTKGGRVVFRAACNAPCWAKG